MFVTGFVALALLGFVVWWDKQMPRPDQQPLTSRQRVLAVTAVLLGVAGPVFACFWVPAALRAPVGVYDALTASLGVAIGLAGLVILALTAFRLGQRRRAARRA